MKYEFPLTINDRFQICNDYLLTACKSFGLNDALHVREKSIVILQGRYFRVQKAAEYLRQTLDDALYRAFNRSLESQ